MVCQWWAIRTPPANHHAHALKTPSYSIIASASLTSSIRRATCAGVSTGWLNSTVWFTVTAGTAACAACAVWRRVEVGDTDGETRTLHTYNKQEAELKAWAKQELERLKRDGLVGSFTTFGAELVDKLDNVGIKIDGERKGVYQVQKNVIKYSPSGFRQEITLGARVAE